MSIHNKKRVKKYIYKHVDIETTVKQFLPYEFHSNSSQNASWKDSLICPDQFNKVLSTGDASFIEPVPKAR